MLLILNQLKFPSIACVTFTQSENCGKKTGECTPVINMNFELELKPESFALHFCIAVRIEAIVYGDTAASILWTITNLSQDS